MWLLGAVYVGGLIGFIAGSLWAVLDRVERRIWWGLGAGLGAGAIAGIVNVAVLRSGEWLPEVSPVELFVIGLIGGTFTGLLMGAFRSEG